MYLFKNMILTTSKSVLANNQYIKNRIYVQSIDIKNYFRIIY